MAINGSSLTSGTDNATTTSYATASVAPTDGRMVYVGIGTMQVSGSEASAASPSSLSGNSLTWTKVAEEVDTTVGLALSVWRALAASSTSGAITMTHGSNRAASAWSVVEVASADTGGTNGANSVVQSASNKDNTGAGTAISATLGAFSDAGNGALSFSFSLNAGAQAACTPGSGWTELNETAATEGPISYEIQAQWRADNDTTADVTWSIGGYPRILALEIKAASAGIDVRTGWFRF